MPIKLNIDDIAKFIRENGLIDHGGAKLCDLCDAFSFTRQAFYKRMKDDPEFAKAVNEAKEEFRSSLEVRLVKSLAKSAEGYEWKQTCEEYEGGKLKKRTVRNMYAQPNVAASIFLLTNLNPSSWRNRQSVDATTDGKPFQSPISIEIIDRREQVAKKDANDTDDTGIRGD